MDNPSIIGIVLGIIIILPGFILGMSSLKSVCSEITDKPFFCPNCGHKFYVKWYRMLFNRYSVYICNGAKLKCPNCKVNDMCRHDE